VGVACSVNPPDKIVKPLVELDPDEELDCALAATAKRQPYGMKQE
jgi:hypothetical protein